MNSDLAQLLENCEQSSDFFELQDHFQKFIGKYGYNNLVVTGIPTVEQSIADVLFLSSYPKEWQKIYQSRNYEKIDPVSQMSMVARLPFTWADAKKSFSKNSQTKSILKQGQDFALRDGLVVPMFDMIHFKSVIAMSSDKKRRLPKKIINSISLASFAFKISLDQLTGARMPDVNISCRELEILKWTSVGKSNWDISQILSISQRTVEAHLSSARRKLRAMNTTHAVAKAVRLGLFVP